MYVFSIHYLCVDNISNVDLGHRRAFDVIGGIQIQGRSD